MSGKVSGKVNSALEKVTLSQDEKWRLRILISEITDSNHIDSSFIINVNKNYDDIEMFSFKERELTLEKDTDVPNKNQEKMEELQRILNVIESKSKYRHKLEEENEKTISEIAGILGFDYSKGQANQKF